MSGSPRSESSTGLEGERHSAYRSARTKAYRRLMPLLFVSYVIAYVDRTNLSIAKLTMVNDLPGFDNAVFGAGAGMFFIGYLLLEIPGSLLVERWSARKWLSRIMITWGGVAAATAWVKTPTQFYVARFLLGLAEAGFFPGVIIYLTHWFTSRDRTRALSYFLAAGPIAQIISPKISNVLLVIGTDALHPKRWGLVGWQWVYIFWGVPALVLGFGVLGFLTDRPRDARWLTSAERGALEEALTRDREEVTKGQGEVSVRAALFHPRILMLTGVCFFLATANYGVEFFMPSILQRQYGLNLGALTWAIILPSVGVLIGQIVLGWTSDVTRERWLHASVPLFFSAALLALTPVLRGQLWATLLLFSLAMFALRGAMPAFWSLPHLFLSGGGAAASIGLINAMGNLGGFLGAYTLGKVDSVTGSFSGGIYFLCVCLAAAGGLLLFMRHRVHRHVEAIVEER